MDSPLWCLKERDKKKWGEGKRVAFYGVFNFHSKKQPMRQIGFHVKYRSKKYSLHLIRLICNPCKLVLVDMTRGARASKWHFDFTGKSSQGDRDRVSRILRVSRSIPLMCSCRCRIMIIVLNKLGIDTV